jgi:anti-sigma28 factor (negative regulator of flagellin synthesis)
VRIINQDKVLSLEPSRAPKARVEGGEKVPNGPDTVRLSGEVQRLRQERLERVERLAAEVREGTYKPDLDAIAEAIVLKEGS